LAFIFFDGARFLRLEELTWVGTSGYQRITEPLLATLNYLSNHPCGPGQPHELENCYQQQITNKYSPKIKMQMCDF
jgi:hypothetical protein